MHVYLNLAFGEIKREMKDDRLGKEIKKIQVKPASLEQITEEIGEFNLLEMPVDFIFLNPLFYP